MKKKSGSKIVTILTRIFKVRSWFDWDRMRAFTLYLVNGFKNLFFPRRSVKAESFNEATRKFEITDAHLLAKQKALLRLSVLMLLAAVLILIYAGYQLFYGSFSAFIVSFIVTLIALTLAFRYHFWYFQIKKRKLGCTFDEWFRQGLLGEKK